ncbi:MAG: Ig-like domain-containing protein, partial [Sphingobacteriales bacterium]|nr:Ig-like domain-containing protein [Sphingobacteriales bacterium]
GSIAQGFITNAGIPSTAYNYLAPSLLGTCSDIFVMPHADPTWATHGNLYNWNLTYKGAIWLGCHAGSALENMYNPANTSQQTNFLSNKTSTAGTGVILPASGSTAYAQNSLVLWGNHTTATVPYNTNTAITAPQTGTAAAADDWVSQFIGVTDAAHLNGSEQVYLPVKGQSWRASTKIITYDPTQSNVPSISDGAAVIMAYGNGFGDPNRGQVMLEAGHSINKGTVGDVSAQRAFFNWSYLVVKDKAIKVGAIQGIPQNGNINGITNLSVSANSPVVTSGSLTYLWKAVRADNGADIGSFSVNNSTSAASTVYNPGSITGSVNILITISVKDPCGRTTTTTVPTTLKQGPTAPVAQNDVAGISADCYTPGGSVTINVLNNDTDVDGDINPNSVLLQNPSNASAYGTSYTVANLGVWTTNGASVGFTPATNFFGTATINYKVCDFTSLCSTASISVGVGTADSRGCYPGSTWGIQDDDTTKSITSNTNVTNAANILGQPDYDDVDNTTYATIAKNTSNNAVLDFGSTVTTLQFDSLRLYWASNVNGNSSSVKLQFSIDNVTYTNLSTL